MTIEVVCLTCRKPVDKLGTTRNAHMHCTDVDVWCHGQHDVLTISDMIKMLGGAFRLEAFRPPLKVITDHDHGDEDAAR